MIAPMRIRGDRARINDAYAEGWETGADRTLDDSTIDAVWQELPDLARDDIVRAMKAAHYAVTGRTDAF